MVTNYLEAIYMLYLTNKIHSIHIVKELNFSKSSISNALKKLVNQNYISIDVNNHIRLTDITSGFENLEAGWNSTNTASSNWYIFEAKFTTKRAIFLFSKKISIMSPSNLVPIVYHKKHFILINR